MSEKTGISWTHHTFNPWWGCVKVSPACTNCYAERQSQGWPNFHDGETKPLLWGQGSDRRFFGDAHWKQPLRWNANAKAAGERRRVFCASMADVFEVPFYNADEDKARDLREQMDRERRRLYALIERTPWLDWLLLTKRPGYVMGHVPAWWRRGFPDNVFVGVTAETQGWLEHRILELLGIPARVRFLSIEPMLGPMNLRRILHKGALDDVYVDALTGQYEGDLRSVQVPTNPRGLQWIIAGAESGTEARPSHPEWFRALRDACVGAGVPFHFKQWGEYIPIAPIYGTDAHYGDIESSVAAHEDRCEILTPHDVWIDGDGQPPSGSWMMERVGKKKAGRVLDGRTWDEFPSPVAA